MKFFVIFPVCFLFMVVLNIVEQVYLHKNTITIVDSRESIVFVSNYREATAIDYEMKGYMRTSIPHDACTQIDPPIFHQNYTMKKIVLINGTAECDFMTKVQNARAVGYDVAVLSDPYPGHFEYPNWTFPLSLPEVNLTVLLISYEDAISINKFLYHNISDEEHFIITIPVHESWEKFVLFQFCINLGVGCFCLFFLGGLKWLFTKVRNRNEESRNLIEEIEENESLLHGNERNMALLQEFAIASLLEHRRVVEQEQERISTVNGQRALPRLKKKCPSREFPIDASTQMCVCCQYNIEPSEKYRTLDCNHAYHADCIDSWFVTKGGALICPLCSKQFDLESSAAHSLSNSTECQPMLNPTNSLPTSRYLTEPDTSRRVDNMSEPGTSRRDDSSCDESDSSYRTPAGSFESEGFLAGAAG